MHDLVDPLELECHHKESIHTISCVLGMKLGSQIVTELLLPPAPIPMMLELNALPKVSYSCTYSILYTLLTGLLFEISRSYVFPLNL